MVVLLVIAVVVGLYMAWNIGANDVANSMANAVGSRSLSLPAAIILAALCEFSGAVLVGSHVTDTIRKGIVDPQAFIDQPGLLAHGMVCAMLGAGVWLNLATYLGMPVSTTHSIVGAVIGFGLVHAGFRSIYWGKLGQIVASWFISPILGAALAYVVFRLITRYILAQDQPIRAARRGVPAMVFFAAVAIILAILYRGLENLHLNLSAGLALTCSVAGGLVCALAAGLLIRRRGAAHLHLPLEQQLHQIERMFIPPVILSSCTVAFAHGANDVANAVGPLAAVIDLIRRGAVSTQSVPVETWVLVLGGVGIVLGLATFGYRVMRVLGTQVTEITPSRGMAADLATMVTVLGCSKLGLPISTTHTLVGAVLGVGLARGITAINARVVRAIFSSWGATVPLSALLTIIFFLLDRWFFW